MCSCKFKCYKFMCVDAFLSVPAVVVLVVQMICKSAQLLAESKLSVFLEAPQSVVHEKHLRFSSIKP